MFTLRQKLPMIVRMINFPQRDNHAVTTVSAFQGNANCEAIKPEVELPSVTSYMSSRQKIDKIDPRLENDLVPESGGKTMMNNPSDSAICKDTLDNPVFPLS